MFSGVFFQRYILGLWVMAEGIIYDMFNKDKHVVKTEDRPYTSILCVYRLWYTKSDSLWIVGIFNGKWYKIKEYHYSGREETRQKTDTEFADDLEKFMENLPIKAIIVDPSAASFIAELRKRGLRVRQANNEVIDGIRNVATALNEGMILYNDCCIETFKEFNSYVWDEEAAERGIDKPLEKTTTIWMQIGILLTLFCLTIDD